MGRRAGGARLAGRRFSSAGLDPAPGMVLRRRARAGRLPSRRDWAAIRAGRAEAGNSISKDDYVAWREPGESGFSVINSSYSGKSLSRAL